MSCYYIIGLRLDNRTHNAVQLQDALTKHGCNIRVRLGLHEIAKDLCANDGVIVLQPCGDRATIDGMLNDFNALEGVTAKLIDLN